MLEADLMTFGPVTDTGVWILKRVHLPRFMKRGFAERLTSGQLPGGI